MMTHKAVLTYIQYALRSCLVHTLPFESQQKSPETLRTVMTTARLRHVSQALHAGICSSTFLCKVFKAGVNTPQIQPQDDLAVIANTPCYLRLSPKTLRFIRLQQD